MATLRKLQGEIDKTLKKVQEGLAVFDDIWEQLYATDNANQKEKLEGNLKTEIKKLQRFRDQIKTWHANSEIKDKSSLADARRDIERRMEKFKVCEKEAKTKAFSKEGLQAAAARQDPKEKAKQEMRDWLNATVDTLNTQIEEFEAEIEDLSSGATRGKKSKPLPRVVSLEEFLARHRQHITRLEQMLRLLDNDEITTEDVEGIKDLVDDYLDRSQDDPEEFEIPDDLYADVLDQLEGMAEAVVAAPPSHSKVAKDREAQKEREREEKERERQKAAALAAKAQLAAQGNTRLMSETEPSEEKKVPPGAATPVPAKTVAVTAVPVAVTPVAAAASAAVAATVGGAASASTTPIALPRSSSKEPASPAAAAAAAAALAAAAPPPPPSSSGPGTPLRAQPQGLGATNGPQLASPLTPTGSGGTSTTAPAGQHTDGGFPALESGNGVGQASSPATLPPPTGLAKPHPPVGPALGAAAAAAAAAAQELPIGSGPYDPRLMDGGLEQLTSQMGAMGIQDSTAGLTPAQCLQLLQAAAPRSIPQPGDSQWQQLPLRPRPPPVAPPSSYPAQRLGVFENPALYDKLDPETLFFAFYQQPGSHQQYLAARSLKQQAWRFHKQHQAWFQRHAEPKAGGQPGDDWEQGTYVYFDSQLREAEGGAAPTGWCYRLKSDFLFKYDALEDELVA